MALKGEQFHNTYMPGRPDWLSPEHHTQQGPKNLTKLHTKDLYSGVRPEFPVTDDEITTFDVNTNTKASRVSGATGFGQLQVNNAPVPTPQEEIAPGTNRQGMLFDPYTGTGLPRDPTVSKEQRLAAVDRQLNLRGKGAPQLAERRQPGFRIW